MWMCDHCLEVNTASDNFCTNCGRPQPGTEDLFKPATPAKEEPVDKRFKAVLAKSGYRVPTRDAPGEDYIPGFGEAPENRENKVSEEPAHYEFISHYADAMIRRVARITALYVLLPLCVVTSLYFNVLWLKSQQTVKRYNSECTESAAAKAPNICSHADVSAAFRLPHGATNASEVYTSFVATDGKREYLKLWRHSDFDLRMVTGDYPGDVDIKTQEFPSVVTRWRGHYTDIKSNGITYPLDDNPRNNAAGRRASALFATAPLIMVLGLYVYKRGVRRYHDSKEAEGVLSELSRAW